MPEKPFRVLSLDGGGMRGTYTATYLATVAATYAKRNGYDALDVGAAFDLIVGTSTGGIIACALAAGVRMEEVVELYREHGPRIFPKRVPGLPGVIPDLFVRPFYLAAGSRALRAALTEKLKDQTIRGVYEERGIALAIPAVEMSEHKAWVFKTPHWRESTGRDDGYKLVDVCMATSAAPVFRSMASIKDPRDGKLHHVFVDGGLWANNPVVVSLIEALDMARPDQEIEIFCLGTCPTPAGEQIGATYVNRGLGRWKFGAKAAELSIDAQHFAYDHQARKIARHVGRSCRIVRFPSDKVPATLVPYLGLDDTRTKAMDALVRRARIDADMTNSKCSGRATDPEAEMICSLFESAPRLTDPPARRSPAMKPAATPAI